MKHSLICSAFFALMFAIAACGDDSGSATRPSEESSSSVAMPMSSWSGGEAGTIGSSSSVMLSSSSETLSVVDPASVVKGTFADSRDGQTYKTVTIGSQTWMAQNLNFETANSDCHEDKVSNCDKYGRYYTWEAAMNACPGGWHLPTWAEFDVLISAVGGAEIAGNILKSTDGWYNNGNGLDSYGFSILPTGEKSGGEGRQAHFWSSTEFTDTYASYAYLCSDYRNVAVYNNSKEEKKYVRCVKD